MKTVSKSASQSRAPDYVTLGALALLALDSLPRAGSEGTGAPGADPEGGGGWSGIKNGLRGAVQKDPLDALAVTVLAGGIAFYRAERGQNPKVTNLFDALCFVSTCLSVGYDQTFAQTEAGKAIATAVMAVGPAMAAKALDPPGNREDPLLGKLDEILRALQK